MHIHKFQDMMRQIYFQRDSKRGIDGTFDWLVEEVEELRVALKSNDRKALEDEFADVLAWLTSLANVVKIDLNKAATSKYGSKCPKMPRNAMQMPIQ
jgi:NTP pyrophosphatase (non-canonical NTP hydrolase)